jgi:NADP-dependent 3-hydroxy acid dehydrogenase YdfG
MSLNYMGSLHAAKAVYDGMLGRNAGHICFVASTMALMGEQGGRLQQQQHWRRSAMTHSDTKQCVVTAGVGVC